MTKRKHHKAARAAKAIRAHKNAIAAAASAPEVVNITAAADHNTAPVPLPVRDDAPTSRDPRQKLIQEKQAEHARRQDVIRHINAEKGFEAYIHKTIILEGYIKGLTDSLTMAPPIATPESE